MKTLIDVLLEAAQMDHKGISFVKNGKEKKHISYRELLQKSSYTLYHLQKRGILPGNEVLIKVKDMENFVYSFWACILGGYIAVPVTSDANESTNFKTTQIINKLKVPFIIAEDEVLEQYSQYLEMNSELMEHNNIEANFIGVNSILEEDQLGKIASRLEDTIAYIQFSSGTTNNPKGVVLLHKNVLSNLDAIKKCGNVLEEDRIISWMPLTHDMGLVGFHLLPIYNKMEHCIYDTKFFMLRPMQLLKDISQEKYTITCLPNFACKHLLNHFKIKDDMVLDLSSVKSIYNGSEPISVEIIEKFLSCMEPYGLKREAMYPVYGMAEAVLGISFPVCGEHYTYLTLNRDHLNIGESIEIQEKETFNSIKVVCEGHTINECSLRIVSEENILEEKYLGEIQISGSNVTPYYYNNNEESQRLFTADGWLKTGDTGFIYKGKLYVVGRLKDIIFVNGKNYYSHDLEEYLGHQVPSLEKKVIVCSLNEDGKEDKVILCVVCKKITDAMIEKIIQLKRVMTIDLGIEVTSIIPVTTIYKTTSGKIKRYQYVEEYVKGEHNIGIHDIEDKIIEWKQKRDSQVAHNPLEKEILDLVKSVLNTDYISVDDNFSEYLSNSLMMVKLNKELKEHIDEKIDITDLYNYPTIHSLAQALNTSNTYTLEGMKIANQKKYFKYNDPINEIYFTKKYSSETIDSLKYIKSSLNLEIESSLLTPLIITLKRHIVGNIVKLYTHTVSSKNLFLMSIDCSKISTLQEFVQGVNSQLLTQNIEENLLLKISESNRAESEVTVAFLSMAMAPLIENPHQWYDIIIFYGIKDQEITLNFQANSRVIESSFLEMFVKDYISAFNHLNKQLLDM